VQQDEGLGEDTGSVEEDASSADVQSDEGAPPQDSVVEDVGLDAAGDSGAEPDASTPTDTPADTPVDPDTAPAQDANVETELAPSWFKTFGGINNEEVKAVTADSQGNVYVTGIFRNTFTIGDQTLEHSQPGTDTADFFVASYAPDASFRWAHAYGANGNDNTFEIAIDDQDRIYVAGAHHSNLTVGEQVLQVKGGNDADIFVISFDTEGELLWAKNWGGPYGETPRDLSINPAGDVFITGSYQGSMTADDFTVPAEVGTGHLSDVFVLAVDAESHDAIWLKSYAGDGHDVGTALEADNTRNVVLGVSYQYDLTLNDTVSLNTGGMNFRVGLIRLDHTGEVVFAQDFGGPGVLEIIGLGLGEGGHAYFTGVFSETVNFGGEDLVAADAHDVMLASFGPNGDHLWSVGFTGSSFDQAIDLEVKDDGIYITGRFKNDLNFGELVLNSPDNYDIFLGRFSTVDGSPIWVDSAGGVEDDQANGIGLAGDGGIFVGGYHRGTITFDGATTPAASVGTDCFVFRYTQ
jgi:hypothetical protein